MSRRSIKKVELVEAGVAAVRDSDGNHVDEAQLFAVVPGESDEAVPLEKNERLVMVATVHNNRREAEERFIAARAGKPRSCPDGTPLYVKEASSGPEGLTAGEQKVCNEIVSDLLAIYAQQREELKAVHKRLRAMRKRF